MDRKFITVLLCLMFFLIGCGERSTTKIPEYHVQYLESFGWKIDSMVDQSERYVRYSSGPEWEPYWGKEVQVTTYVLQVKQVNGGRVYASITEFEGEILAGSGSLEDWTPGVFALSDKERLIEDGIIER